ncbi:MAG: polysaccharide biosynthesis C-terminal domain-containing protein [Malacoplasma sp.]|nr:polysaccharide biosynthesis C-terminal domain-containing protein [Malacoplasma sp.]
MFKASVIVIAQVVLPSPLGVGLMAVTKIKFDFALWKKLLIWGLPFALTSIFYSIYFSIDIVMITQLVGDYATGIYNASYKIIDALALFYLAFMAVVFPIMSKQFKYNNSSLDFTFKRITKYVTIITLCICVWIMFYSYDLIVTMFGTKFTQSAYLLQILIWTICFLYINATASTVLNAAHKEYTVSAVYLVAAIFNVILNLFLIPKYSYFGAAFATVISEILILALLLYVLKKMNITVDKKLIVDILKICLSAVIFGIFFYFIKLNVILSIPVGLFVFFILLIITRSFDNEDKAIFKEIIRKTD